ncbi:MAG: hypothetical protein LBK71_06085 [Verrucomicrobiales bacterium]|jgi:hypothetical protein|nr:hypothetical protein [Verrucomicrobiales bacterium]
MRKLLKICAWALAFIVSLTVLFYVEENWRGARAWRQTTAALKARGYPLTIAEIIPPPVADAENVAAAPIFAELFTADGKDRRGTRLSKSKLPEVAAALPMMHKGTPGDLRLFFDEPLTVPDAAKKMLAQLDAEWSPLLAEAHDALQRPRCRWPLAYERGFETAIPYINAVLKLAKVSHLRALCRLELGASASAADDVIELGKLAQVLEVKPKLIDCVVAMAIRRLAANTIWSGIVHHQWRAQDLARLQDFFQQPNEKQKIVAALADERAMLLDTDLVKVFSRENPLSNPLDEPLTLMDKALPLILRWQPSGELLLGKCNYAEWMQRNIDTLTVSDEVMHPIPIEELYRQLPQKYWGAQIIFKWASAGMLPMMQTIAKATTYRHQAILACALERYRLRHGKLPLTLDELVPDYLVKIPNQVTVSEPMWYRRVSDRDYILYSVGWNLRDDDATISEERLTDNLDWVWASQPELYRREPGE